SRDRLVFSAISFHSARVMQMRRTRVSEPVIFSVLQTFFSFSAASAFGVASSAAPGAAAMATPAVMKSDAAKMLSTFITYPIPEAVFIGAHGRKEHGLTYRFSQQWQIRGRRKLSLRFTGKLLQRREDPAQGADFEVIPAGFSQHRAQRAARSDRASGRVEIAARAKQTLEVRDHGLQLFLRGGGEQVLRRRLRHAFGAAGIV